MKLSELIARNLSISASALSDDKEMSREIQKHRKRTTNPGGCVELSGRVTRPSVQESAMRPVEGSFAQGRAVRQPSNRAVTHQACGRTR